MTGLCFVDAEVFVYARDPRDAAKQSRALQWIAHLWQERLGRTSVQVLSEYYVFDAHSQAQRRPRRGVGRCPRADGLAPLARR